MPSPHTNSENEPLLGQARSASTYHNSQAVQLQERLHAKNRRRCPKFFWVIVIFVIGSFVGCMIDRFYIYDQLWRRWAQEEELREHTRASWMEEAKQHEVDVIRWKEEKTAMDADRKRWEEERETQRARLIWEDLHPGRCLRYATREYKATLSSIGIGMDALGECANKTLSFRGREILPSFCNLEGPCGRVTGHWVINLDEVGCSPWWDTLEDKGCDGEHKHRYEAHLMNVQDMGDWEILCKTTPTTINGIPHEGATFCLNSLWGVFGIWLVEDMNCS